VIKTRQILSNNTKYYLIDNGIYFASAFAPNSNKGYILENIVFIELLSRGYDVKFGHSYNNNEIDFVAKNEEETIFFQICEFLTEENYNREIGNLEVINNSHKKILLCTNKKFETTESNIKIINLID
jgi:predicted AAA+ superfamily ATPase